MATVALIGKTIELGAKVVSKIKDDQAAESLLGHIRTKVLLLLELLQEVRAKPPDQQPTEQRMQQAQRVLEDYHMTVTQYINQHWMLKFFRATEMKERLDRLDREMALVLTLLDATKGGNPPPTSETIQEGEAQASAELLTILAAEPQFVQAADIEEDREASRATMELQLRARGQSAREALTCPCGCSQQLVKNLDLESPKTCYACGCPKTGAFFSCPDSKPKHLCLSCAQAAGLKPAAYLGRFKVVQDLLLPAEPEDRQRELANSTGATYALLHQAVFWNNLYGVLLLLDNKADIDVRTEALDHALGIPKGSTPLHLAVVTLNVRIVKILLSRGANPEARNEEGKTPVELASGDEDMQALFGNVEELKRMAPNVQALSSRRKFREMFALINERSADPNMKDPNQQYYALHKAAWHGDLDVCLQLICAGAIPNLRSMYNAAAASPESPKLPSEVARARGERHRDCADTLQDIEREADERMARTAESP